MVVKPATELPVVKLLHFSRAQEVAGGAPVVVQPHLDYMEFEGISPHSMCSSFFCVSLNLAQPTSLHVYRSAQAT